MMIEVEDTISEVEIVSTHTLSGLIDGLLIVGDGEFEIFKK